MDGIFGVSTISKNPAVHIYLETDRPFKSQLVSKVPLWNHPPISAMHVNSISITNPVSRWHSWALPPQNNLQGYLWPRHHSSLWHCYSVFWSNPLFLTYPMIIKTPFKFSQRNVNCSFMLCLQGRTFFQKKKKNVRPAPHKTLRRVKCTRFCLLWRKHMHFWVMCHVQALKPPTPTPR